MNKKIQKELIEAGWFQDPKNGDWISPWDYLRYSFRDAIKEQFRLASIPLASEYTGFDIVEKISSGKLRL